MEKVINNNESEYTKRQCKCKSFRHNSDKTLFKPQKYFLSYVNLYHMGGTTYAMFYHKK